MISLRHLSAFVLTSCLFIASNLIATKALAVPGPIISATNNDTTAHGDGTSRPGEQIGYTISIGNSGTTAATGVQLADTPDARTTFVANSVKLSPNAIAHGLINAVGNTPLSVAAGSGLLVGVHDLDGVTPDGSLVLTTGTFGTSQGGSVTIAADGSFTYTPQTGDHNLTDTFTYTVTDGDALASTGTVSINLGARVWYVDNSGANGTGTRFSPFNNFAAAITAANASGDYIYLFKGSANYTGGTLGAGVNLVGAQVDLNVNTILIIAGNAANTPTVGGTLTIANNDTVNGLNISSGGSTGLNAPGTSGSHIATTVSIGSVTSTTGTAVNLSFVDGSLSFTSIASNGATKGISVNSTTGSFTVNGTGTTAGTGGTIQNSTNNGVEFKTATNVTLKNMIITGNGTSQTVAGSASTCGGDIATGNNLSCVANAYLQTVTGATFDNVSVTGSGQQGINGNAVNGLTITNCTITGNGNEGFEDGILLQNASGTVSITGTNVRDNRARELHIGNGSGTMTLNTSTSQYGHTASGTGTADSQQGVLLQLFGTSNSAINASGLTISNNQGSGFTANGFQVNADNGGPIVNGSITNSTFDANAAHVFINAGGTSTITFDTMNNGGANGSMTRADLQAINYTVLGGSSAITASVTGTISGNNIGTAALNGCTLASTNCHAIDINSGEQWNGQMHLKIDSNTIQKVAQGIIFTLGGGSGVTPQVHAKVTANNISNSSLPSVGEAIKLNTTVTSTNPTISVCWDVGGGRRAGQHGHRRLVDRQFASVPLPPQSLQW